MIDAIAILVNPPRLLWCGCRGSPPRRRWCLLLLAPARRGFVARFPPAGIGFVSWLRDVHGRFVRAASVSFPAHVVSPRFPVVTFYSPRPRTVSFIQRARSDRWASE